MILTTLPLHTGNIIQSYCFPISITILKNGNNFLRIPVFILYGLEGLRINWRIRHLLGCLVGLLFGRRMGRPVGRLVGLPVRRIAFANKRTLFCTAGRALALNRDVLYRDALNRAALNRAALNRAALPANKRTLLRAVARALIPKRPLPTAERQRPEK